MHRKLTSACIILVWLLLLCACKTDISVRSLGQDNVYSLRISASMSNDYASQVYHRLCTEYSSKYGISVTDTNSTLTGLEYKRKIINDFAAGNEPDVFYLSIKDAQTMIENGQIVSVQEILNSYPQYASSIRPEMLESLTDDDGLLWCLPIEASYNGLFCNLDLFESLNLEVPETWGDLIHAVHTFRNADIIPIAAGMSDESGLWADELILSCGAEEHNVSPSSVEQIPASWYSALGSIYSLSSSNAFQTDASVSSVSSARALFANGEAAMLLDSSEAASLFADKDRFVVIPFPAQVPHYGEKHIIIEVTSGYFISKKAWDSPDIRDAAVKFVMHMTEPEAVLELSADGTRYPILKTELLAVEDATTELEKSLLSLVQDAEVHSSLRTRLSATAWTFLASGIVPLVRNTGSISQILIQTVAANSNILP